jgi:hypothetical protein
MEVWQADKYGDSREFVKYAIGHFAGKPGVKIPSRIVTSVQDIALEHLGVSDIFRLRDRFEGQAYLDRLLLKVLSLYVLEKTSITELLNIDFIRRNKDSDFTLVAIGGQSFRIIPFIFGSLPIIDSSLKGRIILVAIRSDWKSGTMCGTIELSGDEKMFLPRSIAVNQSYRKFIGFGYLKGL